MRHKLNTEKPRRAPSFFERESEVKALAFFGEHRVFTLAEFEAAYLAGGHSKKSVRPILQYHLSQGRLMSIRRGLYIVAGHNIDRYVVAMKLVPDALIAYDGALSFHGLIGFPYGVCVINQRSLPSFTFN